MITEDMRKIHKKYIKLYNKADRYLNNQQYIKAIECYRKAIKIYPNKTYAMRKKVINYYKNN